MPVPFASMEEVRASAFRHIAGYCRIGGVAVDFFEAHLSHGTEQPVGTARVIIPAPRPASLVIGATLELELGYFGLTRRRFFGSIPQDEYAITSDTYEITITAEGRTAYMRDPDAFGMVFEGPISLKDLYRGAALSRSMDTAFSEETTLPSGATIELGGVSAVDGGTVIIDNRTSPLTLCSRAAELFGYRVYDRPDGQPTQSRVSGLPNPAFDAGELTYDLAPGDYVQNPASSTGVNIRAGAGLSYDVVGRFEGGAYGMISGSETITADGFVWQQIKAFGEMEGWITVTSSVGVPRFTTQTPRQPLYWLTENVNAYEFKHARSSGPMRTYYDVKGASYIDENGLPVAIRTIPAEVPSADELAPLYYRMANKTDRLLVTDQLAVGCRECLEIDTSALMVTYEFDTQGEPEMQPGEIAIVTSSTIGLYHEPQWITHIAEDFTEDEYAMTVECWSGGGQALEAGDDCSSFTVDTNVWHFGNEHLSHYRDPSPDGTDITIDFTVPYSDYSTAILSGWIHGSNTIKTNTAVDGSLFEIWQLEDPTLAESGTNELRRVGSVDMPSHPEELSKRRNYTSTLHYWQYFRLPLPGNLKMGAAELHIIAGEYESDTYDDGEVIFDKITYCGVGIPDLPGTVEVAS